MAVCSFFPLPGLKDHHPVHHPGALGQQQACSRPGLQWDSHGWSPVQALWLRAGTGPPPADTQTAFGSSVLMAFLFLPGRGSFFYFFFLVLFKPLSDKTAYFPAVRGDCLRSGAEVCVAAAVDICLCKVSRKTARNQAASWRWWLSRGLNLPYYICFPLQNTGVRTAVSQSFMENNGQKAAKICSPVSTGTNIKPCSFSFLASAAIFSFLCSQLDFLSSSLGNLQAQGTPMININVPGGCWVLVRGSGERW